MKTFLLLVTSCYSLLTSYQALGLKEKRNPPIAIQHSAVLGVKDITLKGTMSRYT